MGTNDGKTLRDKQLIEALEKALSGSRPVADGDLVKAHRSLRERLDGPDVTMRPYGEKMREQISAPQAVQ